MLWAAAAAHCVGGYDNAENPALDARDADPLWAIDSDNWLHVRVARRRPSLRDQRFSLWRVPGRKSLTLAGDGLRFTARCGEHRLHAELNDAVAEDTAFVVTVPLADGLGHRLRQVQSEARLLEGEAPPPRARASSRTGLLHLRALQAIDGVRGGASHRDIAAAIFGADTVGDRWSADSELRAQVRYLVSRAEGLVGGGYRALAGLLSPGDERAP